MSTRHVTMVLRSGDTGTFRQGTRVPEVVSPRKDDRSLGDTQVTYQDIGLDLEVTVDEYGDGAILREGVEQSSVADEKSGVGPQDPIIREVSFKQTMAVTSGKPMRLGSLDIPGGTRHLDIDVTVDPIP